MKMFFIPTWISNVMFLITCVLSGWQHSKLRRANPITNLQFAMMIFSMAMVLVVALYNRTNPWLSLAFFLIAAGCLAFTFRQQRMLPPGKSFE
jgi:hypothetical protein